MPNDMDFIAFQIARLALTYLLHSTLLLGGTWLFLRAARVRSWALRERIWKIALILPMLTAALPLPAAWSRPPAGLTLERLVPRMPSAESDVAQVEESRREPIVEVDLSADSAKTLDVDDAARAAEPRSVGPRLEEYGDRRPTFFANVRSTEGGPALAKPRWSHPTTPMLKATPTAVEGLVGAAVVTAICYTLLTFFIVGTLHVIRRSLVFARTLRDSRPIRDEAVCDVLADLLRQANVRRGVRLLTSTGDRPPAAFGLFRWTIVLPQALVPTLQPDELRALLGHEVAHLARGDALWLWIGRILCACFAFQPLNFLARGQLRLAAEFLCDEWAVRNSASRFALARCLTRVAEWTAHLAPQPLELAALGPRSNLTERVERLVLKHRPADRWDSGRRRWLVWAAAFAVAFGLECSAPRTSLLAEPPRRAADADNSRAIAHSPADSRLADALQSLSEETRDLLSEIERVDVLLKRTTPPDAAIKGIAVRLEARAARLANGQARLNQCITQTNPIGNR
jgi:beta-lactamase regulating signal transducer with metallopeptidase domain